MGAPGPDRQLHSGPGVGQLGGVPPPRGARADHVRPDDGRLVDLHRHPGHPAGHLRDVRRGGGQAVRRHAGRDHHPHRRPGRHGRGPAAGRDHERRRGPRASTCDPSRIERRIEQGYLDVAADDLDDAVRRAIAARDAGTPLSIGLLGNAAEVLPALLARLPGRHRHRPDLGPRPAELPAPRRGLRGHGGAAGRGPGRVHPPGRGVHGRPRGGDGRVHGRRRGGLRLRQLDPRRGAAGRLHPGVRLPRLRARLHPAAVLRGQGAVPVGRAVRRPEGHRRHRRGRARPVPRERAAGPLDQDGPGEGPLPGAARADLLAGLRRAQPGRRPVQRAGRSGATSARPS